MKLEALIEQIEPLDQTAMQAARERQAILTKPEGSLGKLEMLSIQVAGITGEALPHIQHKAVLVMAGDHGVVADGVSAYPQEVTAQMVANFIYGGAAINVLAKHVGAQVIIVDMGVATDLAPHPNLIVRKIARGTQNITRGPAMRPEQALECLRVGVEIVDAEIERGLDILALGEMGIGNTTPSAAIAAAFTGRPAAEIAGLGTGVDEAGLTRKVNAIQRALEINRPNPQNGLDVLAKVGGFEIGGLVGAILGATARSHPVVIDGFIASAAAMIAVNLAPQVRDYFIAAHTSQETGHHLMLEWLGIEPLLDLQMRLGEGTGAVLAISLVEASCKVLEEMATFTDAGISSRHV